MTPIPITVAYGNGNGPEIMEAALHVLRAVDAPITVEAAEMGERIYNQGGRTGVLPRTYDTLRRTGILLKAPVAAPTGKQCISVNDALCQGLNLSIEIHSLRRLHAGSIQHGGIVIHETGMQADPCTPAVMRYAFDYAARQQRGLICITPDAGSPFLLDMMDAISQEFSGIETRIMPLTMAKDYMASGAAAEAIFVIAPDSAVASVDASPPSETAAWLAQWRELSAHAFIGEHCAVFEPAEKRADSANVAAMLHAAALLLHHIGQHRVARRIDQGWQGAIAELGIGAHRHTAEWAECAVTHLPRILP